MRAFSGLLRAAEKSTQGSDEGRRIAAPVGRAEAAQRAGITKAYLSDG